MECVFVEKVGYKWLSRESTIKTGKQTYTYGWTQWLIVPQSSTQVNIWILYGTKVLYGLEAKKITGNIFINSFDNMIHENQNLFVESILNQMKTMKCYFDNELHVRAIKANYENRNMIILSFRVSNFILMPTFQIFFLFNFYAISIRPFGVCIKLNISSYLGISKALEHIRLSSV